MNTTKNPTTNPKPITFTHKIGSTLFQVNVHYDNAGKESLEDKILRMMHSEILQIKMDSDLTNGSKCGTIGLPQADWLPERGSL